MPTILIFIYLIMLFQLAAAVTAMLTWRKWRTHFIKWLAIYLGVSFACSFTGFILDYFKITSYWYFRSYTYIETPMEVLFFCWVYWRYFTGWHKKLPIIGALVFIIAWLMENLPLDEEALIPTSLYYSVGMLIILVFVIAFFYQLFQSSEILTFSRNIMFWISLGLAIFYAGRFPSNTYSFYLQKNIFILKIHIWFDIAFTYIFYILLIIGLIWTKPKVHSI
jgi:hypothetical protein